MLTCIMLISLFVCLFVGLFIGLLVHLSLGTRRSKILIFLNWPSISSWQRLMAALPNTLVSKRCMHTGEQHHSHPEEQRSSDGWQWSQCIAGSFSLAPKEPKTIQKQNGFFSKTFAEAMRKRCGSTAEAGTPFPSRRLRRR